MKTGDIVIISGIIGDYKFRNRLGEMVEILDTAPAAYVRGVFIINGSKGTESAWSHNLSTVLNACPMDSKPIQIGHGGKRC